MAIFPPDSPDQLHTEVRSSMRVHFTDPNSLLLDLVQLGVEERHRAGDDVALPVPMEGLGGQVSKQRKQLERDADGADFEFEVVSGGRNYGGLPVEMKRKGKA